MSFDSNHTPPPDEPETAAERARAAAFAKLVDGLLYRDEVLEKVKKEAGEGSKLLFVDKYMQRVGRPHLEGETISLVYVVVGISR